MSAGSSSRLMTPRSAVPLWLLANGGMVLIVVMYAAWLYRTVASEYASGRLSADTPDTPAIPIFGLALVVLALLPFFNFGVYLLLRRYPGRAPLLRKPMLRGASALLEIAYAAPVVVLLFSLIESGLAGDWELMVLAAYWLLLVICFRAVAHAKWETQTSVRGHGSRS